MNTKKKYMQPLCDVEVAETGEIMIVASNIDVTTIGGEFDVKRWNLADDDAQNGWNNIWDEE